MKHILISLFSLGLFSHAQAFDVKSCVNADNRDLVEDLKVAVQTGYLSQEEFASLKKVKSCEEFSQKVDELIAYVQDLAASESEGSTLE